MQDFGAFTAGGIDTFDTADHYGPSEQLIGAQALRRFSCYSFFGVCCWLGGWRSRRPPASAACRSRVACCAGRFLRDGAVAQDGAGAAEGVTVLTKACIWGSNLGSAGRGDVLEKASGMHRCEIPALFLLPVQFVTA